LGAAILGLVLVQPAQPQDDPPAKKSKKAPELRLPSKSVSITVIQRDEQEIPGSGGSIRVQLGDITDGQALLAIITNDRKSLLERTSVRQGDTVEFPVGNKKYVVLVKELRNNLVGEDFAKLTISEAPVKKPSESEPAEPLTEKQKIEALIKHVEELKGASFIRNDTEYDAKTAAKFLRGKWEQDADIKTAKEFIDKAASVSSTTGRAYSIRFSDGKVLKSSEYLLAELKKIEKRSGG
jgi:hypothetical protein